MTKGNISINWSPELLSERDYAKQTVGIVIRASSEKKLIRGSVGTAALSELKGPNPVYFDCLPTGIAKRPEELTRLGIEGVYPASRNVVAN